VDKATGAKVVNEATCVGCKVCTIACPFGTINYVEETGNYSHGQKEGVWIQFASNGQQLGEAYYKNGLKDGIWTVWDEQGVKRYHMVYSMGKKVDTWKMWDENAVLVSERIYNE
jgi:antitoxin component YwqK of YwqJK toxin-antitoxin module